MKDKNLQAKILSWAKKIKGIEYLGGKCNSCGIDDPVLLEFHHSKYKNFNIKKGYRWSLIKQELDNCTLLCANCHAEHHCKNTRNGINKYDILVDLNTFSCSMCNYSGKYFGSLHFHHLDPKNKEFAIAEFTCRQIKGLTEHNLIDELEKCVLICKNCHVKQHSNGFFEKHKDLIYIKVNEYKEERKPIGDEKIFEMLSSGMKQVEICKELNLPKSTVGTIKKRLINLGLNIPETKKKTSSCDKTVCVFCSKVFDGHKNDKYCCKKCSNLDKSKKPDKETLAELLKNNSSREIGKILSVSHVSVCKWRKFYCL